MSREVPLSRGHVALVDDEDYAPVMAARPWCASEKPWTVYAVRGVKRADGRWTTEPLHRFLTGLVFVDHINGDGLDNQRANLRPADKSQNGANSRLRSSNTSGYRGVTWHKRGGRWVAQIGGLGNHRYLGMFADPADAARAYDGAAREMYGEYARLNFPTNQETTP